MDSLDPRINRLEIPSNWNEGLQKEPLDQLETFEVFVQAQDNKPYQHEGIVHASDKDFAFLFAKEQFSRRYTCTGIWVCKTREVFVSPYTEAGNSVYDLELPPSEEDGEDSSFEIFHLYKRGKQHKLAGTVNARGYKHAMQLAKGKIEESKPVLNVWVIKAEDFLKSEESDKDIWKTLPDKQFRDAIDYRGADKIKEYKERNKNQ